MDAQDSIEKCDIHKKDLVEGKLLKSDLLGNEFKMISGKNS